LTDVIVCHFCDIFLFYSYTRNYFVLSTLFFINKIHKAENMNTVYKFGTSQLCRLAHANEVYRTVATTEFFGWRGTARAPEFRLGHVQKN